MSKTTKFIKLFLFFLITIFSFIMLEAQGFEPPPIVPHQYTGVDGLIDWVISFITTVGAWVVVYRLQLIGLLPSRMFAPKEERSSKTDPPSADKTTKKILSFITFFFISIMALPAINITLQDGGLGLTAPDQSHISGLVIYAPNGTTLTSVPGTTMRAYYGIEQVESDGITATATNNYAKMLHYHAQEFFAQNPNGALYTYLLAAPSSLDFEEVKAMQVFANGTIRQFGIYITDALTEDPVVTLNGVLDELRELYTPSVAVIGFGDMPDDDIPAYPDLTESNAPMVAVMVSCLYEPASVTGNAKYLATTLSLDIPYVGGTLGILSKAPIPQNIGWVEKFNLKPKAVSGAVIHTDALAAPSYGTINEWEALHDKGYVFIRTYQGYGGFYYNSDSTATAMTSDYSNLRNNRVINQAIRGTYTALVPYHNAPVRLISGGKLAPEELAKFENAVNSVLLPMKQNNEVSDYSIVIDPSQNVASTGTIEISARILPIGCSQFFDISLGYTTTV